MKTGDTLNPDGDGFHPFLHAVVGMDGRGTDVTVLSALARLGLDPWAETAALASLGREAALARLANRLAGLHEVPTLMVDHMAVARNVLRLLPHAAPLPSPAGIAVAVASGTPDKGVVLALVLAVVVVLSMVLQGGTGP